MSPPPEPVVPPTRALAVTLGPAMLLATVILPAPAGLSEQGWRVLGLVALMALWWTLEPVPIGMTALLPPLLLPLLAGMDIGAVTAPYANPLVFLFLGGFVLAAGLERWHLPRRLAWQVLARTGTRPGRLVFGVMLVATFLSMWISNTAAVLLLLPVALSLAALADGRVAAAEARRFALALLLGLAYGASIGGMATLIGSPPNALAAGYLRDRFGIDLSFAAWSALALPLVAFLLPATWLLLTRLLFPAGPAVARALATATVPAAARAPLTAPERRMGLLFAGTALLWCGRPLLNSLPGLGGLTDTGIAVAAALALFIIPAGGGTGRPLLVWREAAGIPWQILILFGGGLSLAAAIESSGLAGWIGQGLAAASDLPPLLFLLAIAVTIVLLTELASNTATVAALLPVTVALVAGDAAVTAVAATVALAASCAFMLPVATPPNALVFGSGHVLVADMARAGAALNVIAALAVPLAVWLLTPLLF